MAYEQSIRQYYLVLNPLSLVRKQVNPIHAGEVIDNLKTFGFTINVLEIGPMLFRAEKIIIKLCLI